MLFTTALLALSASAASATNLWIADYGGIVTTAALTEAGGEYSLEETSTTDKCAPNPSWLTVDTNRGLLFCLNEGMLTPNGSIASFTINDDASLNFVTNETSIVGPVSGLIYGNPTGDRGLVAAHYLGSAVTTWKLKGQGQMEHNQDLIYSEPLGPDQTAPHAHEAILDPTGQYIVVPDLGSDLIRIFSWDKETLELTALDPFAVAPGTGPRHAVFNNPFGVACETCTTHLYLVGELAADVTSFEVSYKPDGKGLGLEKIDNQKTQKANPANAPAEIAITPDSRFLIVSNRDTSSTGQSSLASFCLHDDGTLLEPEITISEKIGAGYPRHFSLNKAGSLVAVGLQYLQEALILPRNVSSGEIGSVAVANITVPGNVTNIMWDL